MSEVVYAREQDLSVDDYIAVVGSTYMRDKRPVSNRGRIDGMLRGANMIATARERPSGTLLGLARGISDGEWVCYLADLVVRDGHQGCGIGTGLLQTVKRMLGPGMGVVLVAYPEAVAYYRKIGLGEMAGFYVAREMAS